LRSGELAKLAGVSSDTLRLYERKGLLPKVPRSSNGYRAYPPETLQRVHLVRAALSIGFTLDELATFFERRDKGEAPCEIVRAKAEAKLRNLEAHLQHLVDLRARLCRVLKEWDRTLKSTPRTERARLLESLAAAVVPGTETLSRQWVPSLTRPFAKEQKHD